MNELEEMRKKLIELFKLKEYETNNFKIEISTHGSKNYVTITKMYDKPVIPKDMTLSEFFKCIKDIIGAKYIYLGEDIHQTGCDTCEYVSRYGWEFIASDKPIETSI